MTRGLHWNAVWDAETALETDAWTAEFRIPLSQLRYSDKNEQVWACTPGVGSTGIRKRTSGI